MDVAVGIGEKSPNSSRRWWKKTGRSINKKTSKLLNKPVAENREIVDKKSSGRYLEGKSKRFLIRKVDIEESRSHLTGGSLSTIKTGSKTSYKSEVQLFLAFLLASPFFKSPSSIYLVTDTFDRIVDLTIGLAIDRSEFIGKRVTDGFTGYSL